MSGTHYILKTGTREKRVAIADCWRFQTIDLAASEKTSADWFVDGTWDVTPDRELILVHVLRERREGPDVKNLFRQNFHFHKPQFAVIEKNGLGMPIVQDLVREGYPIRGVWQHRDKVSRALGPAARYQSGMIYHPEEGPDWLRPYETELLSCPNGAHDDQVDMLSMAAEVIIPEAALFNEFNPRFHTAPEEAETLEDTPIIVGWSEQPYLSVVVGQRDEFSRFRVWLAGAIPDGTGEAQFIGDLARMLDRQFAEPFGRQLRDLEVEHYGPPSWFGRVPSPIGRAVRQILRDGGGVKGYGWHCQEGASSRDYSFSLIRNWLSTINRGEPALSLAKGSGRLADAFLGGCRYRRGVNGELQPEPEQNRDLAIMEALGNALARLELAAGDRENAFNPVYHRRPAAGTRTIG